MDSSTITLFTGMWLVTFGFALGLMVTFLVWHLLQGKPSGKRRFVSSRSLTYSGDLRRTIGALQHIQAMLGRASAEREPSLADIVRLIRTMQREFGRRASLENVIQALVARDINQQLARRKHKRIQPQSLGSATQVEDLIRQNISAKNNGMLRDLPAVKVVEKVG